MFINKLFFVVASTIALSACTSSDPTSPDPAINGSASAVTDSAITNNDSAYNG